MDRETRILIDYFPALANDPNFKITSPWTYDYNCIAWAAGFDNVRFWPYVEDEDGNIIPPEEYEDGDDEIFWPAGVDRTKSIKSFVDCFSYYGYTPCSDGSLEPGFIKVVLFAKDGEASHACRQLPNGLWTSKMGPLNDIQHSNPSDLEGDFYGNVCCYMKKPL